MDAFIFFFILMLLSALFSSAETAFFSLTPARVRLMVGNKMFAAKKVEFLKSRPRRLLITILVGNNIVNLTAASYATVIATQFFGSAAIGIATGVTTVVVLLCGEILPKSFAIAHKERVVMITAWPIFVIYVTLYPIVMIFYQINAVFYKIMGITHKVDTVNEEEIRILTRMGVESGAIDLREHEMIENVFQFDDVHVRDVMTKIDDVEALNASVSIEKIAFSVAQIGHSRYPVHDGDEDDFIGYVHVNTIMQKLNSDERDRPVGDFVSPIHYIQQDTTIEKAFRGMSKKYAHMFIVRDDMGNNVGLITLEDILEELVGEIIDETDMTT